MLFSQVSRTTLLVWSMLIAMLLLMGVSTKLYIESISLKKQAEEQLSESQKYDILQKSISNISYLSEAEGFAVEGGCELVSAVTTIAQAGFDVLPREDKWNYKSTWNPAYMVKDSTSCLPDTTKPAGYYIVEYRFAVPDTFALVRLERTLGGSDIGVGFRVAAVNPQMTKMSIFSEPFYTDSLFYGIDFDTPEWACGR